MIDGLVLCLFASVCVKVKCFGLKLIADVGKERQFLANGFVAVLL